MANKGFYQVVVYADPKEVPIDEEALQAFNREARGAMNEAVDEFYRAVKTELRRSKFPPPAKEGRPPAFGGGMEGGRKKRRESNLMASFRKLRVRVSRGMASGGIESRHPGAGRLEYGAYDTHGIKTHPHPYLGPAAKKAEPSITNIFSRIVQI